MAEPTHKDVEQCVAAWMSAHRPEIQGERDGKAGIPLPDSSEITPYERQLVESFEKQSRIVNRKFLEKETELYPSFKSVTATLKNAQKECDRLRARVGDRDPEVYIPKAVFFLVLSLSFIGLSLLDTYLLRPIFEGDKIPVILAIVLAASQVIIAYYLGRLTRQHRLKRLVLVFLIALLVCLVSVFLIVLYLTDFDLKELIYSLANPAVFLLVTVSTFLAYDSEPTYPSVKKTCDHLSKEAIRLASERIKNLEKYRKDQHLFIEGAQELDTMYRKALQRSRPHDDLRIIREAIFPEFKPVELELQHPEEISKVVDM